MVILVVVYTITTLGLTNCSNEQLIDDSWTPKILSDETLYLPDWSTAGYAWGERDIPVLEPTLYAKDFGVVADDGEDDSEALQAAFKAVHEAEGTVVLRLPAGKIILSEILYIERSNFVLQGAGDVEGGTVIYMPKALSEIPDPDDTYIAHHLEKGYNAIYLTNVTQSWFKNVSVHNGLRSKVMLPSGWR